MGSRASAISTRWKKPPSTCQRGRRVVPVAGCSPHKPPPRGAAQRQDPRLPLALAGAAAHRDARAASPALRRLRQRRGVRSRPADLRQPSRCASTAAPRTAAAPCASTTTGWSRGPTSSGRPTSPGSRSRTIACTCSTRSTAWRRFRSRPTTIERNTLVTCPVERTPDSRRTTIRPAIHPTPARVPRSSTRFRHSCNARSRYGLS